MINALEEIASPLGSLWDRLGGVRGLSGGVFARGDSLGDPVSLSLSQHLDSLSGDPPV